MNLKRILLICPPIEKGGMETYVKTEVDELTGLGYKVILYTLGTCNRELFGNNKNLNIVEGSPNPNTPDSFLCNLKELKKLFIKDPYLLIHTHDHYSLLLSSCLASNLELRLLVTFHSTFSFYEKKDPFEMFFHQLVISRMISKALLLSEEMQEKAFLHFTQLDDTIFRNPILVPDPLPNPVKLSSNPRVLIVSRLDEDKKKSVERAIESMSQMFPNSSIYIAGDGSAKYELEKNIQNKEVANKISFLGHKNEMVELYHSSDLIVGMGRVVLEGLSFGKITILSGYDGIIGVVSPRKYNSFKFSNFSGRGLIADRDLEKLKRDIYSINLEDLVALQGFVNQEFNAKTSWTKIVGSFSNLKEQKEFKELFMILPIAVEEAKKKQDKNIFSSFVVRDILANFIFSNPKYKDLIYPFIYYENKSKDELIKRLEDIQYYLKRDLSIQEQLSKTLQQQLASKEIVS